LILVCIGKSHTLSQYMSVYVQLHCPCHDLVISAVEGRTMKITPVT